MSETRGTKADPATPLALGYLKPIGKLTRRLGWSGKVAGVIAVSLVLIAIFGPFFVSDDANRIDLSSAFASPSFDHFLGADASGRDIFQRLILGARISLLGPAILILIATVVGSLLAISAAWRGGLWDLFVSRATDIMLAFPPIVLALLVIAIAGTGLTSVIGGLAAVYSAYVIRIVRAAAIRERSLPYIEACHAQGQSGFRICVRHMLPNMRNLIFGQSAALFGYAMIDVAGLSFLGVGVQPPETDWGLMVLEGKSSLTQGHPAEAFYAGALIIVAVVSFNVLADRFATGKKG